MSVITRLPQSVHVFLVQRGGPEPLYLVLERVPRPELGLPGFWQGVSGALEPGESFLDAGRREVLEETGIRLASVIPTGFVHRYPIRDEWRSAYGHDVHEVEERTFYAVVDVGTEPQLSVEHVACQWLAFSHAEQILDFGRTRDCLSSVRACLRT